MPTIGKGGNWLTFAAAPIMNENGRTTTAIEVIHEANEKARGARHFDLMKKIVRVEGTIEHSVLTTSRSSCYKLVEPIIVRGHADNHHPPNPP